MKSALFTTSEDDLCDTVKKYKKKAPEPLCKQFTDRRSKQDAIKRHKERKALDCHALFPSCEYCRSYKLYSTKNILKSRSEPVLYVVQVFHTVFFIVEEQTQQQNELTAQQEVDTTAQQTQSTRRCTKCKEPMKGHPRGRCPDSVK